MFALLVGFVLNTGAFNSKADESSKEQENLVSEKQLPKIGSQIGKFNKNDMDYIITSYIEGDCQYTQVIDTNGDTRKDLIFTNNNKFLKVIEYKKLC